MTIVLTKFVLGKLSVEERSRRLDAIIART